MADWIGVDVDNATRICGFEECNRPFYGNGWCQLHYNRVRKHGRPEGRAFTRNRDLGCSIEGCDRTRAGRDLCSLHYQRWQRHGDPLFERQPNVCVINGCESRVASRGWCSKHYTRWSRYGSPTFRIRGEIVDGRRICPGCSVDRLVSDYSAATGRCKPCQAAERRVTRLEIVRVPLPDVHCIVCATAFTPRTSKNYCCSVECTDARKIALDGYYGKVDRHLESGRRWRKNNPDRHIEIQGRRRSRKERSQVIPLTRQMLAERMEYFGNKCWMCGGAFECIDHVKPISKGGPHILANLRPACNRCNGSKSNKWEGVAALQALVA